MKAENPDYKDDPETMESPELLKEALDRVKEKMIPETECNYIIEML